jgi:transposase
MTRYIEGWDRRQNFLLPECLDDYVSEDNPIRVVEAFVDELDLHVLGFERAAPAETGRPGYHPAILLKLYVYGYLNRIRSSRRLEREAQRNVELMWLVRRLVPDFKTIADFRRDNGVAIRAACRQFVILCRGLGLFAQAMAAIDGSKFKAVNNRDRNYTTAKVEKRIEQVNASIERYLARLEQADREENDVPEARTERLRDKITSLRRQMQFLKEMQAKVGAAPDGQISLTDPDARSMATSGRGTGIVGYNVQLAVDTEHHLIMAHEVVNEGHDRSQLVPMGLGAKDAAQATEITILADRGYFNGEQVLACDGTGVLPCVPKIDTSGRLKLGLFARGDFVYDATADHYTCPAGAHLTKGVERSDNRGDITHYRNLTACLSCELRPRCTPEKIKRFKRWKHEAVLDAMQTRLDQLPDAMALRRQTVEHVFGTFKAWGGITPFLTRTLEKVRTEMSLAVLAYNIKRVIKLLGVAPVLQAIRA